MSEYALRLANATDTAARVRAADALGLTPNGAVRSRGGLRADGGGVVSIVAGTMTSQVTAFSCWVDASPAGQVGYPFVCDSTKTLTHDPGDASLVRVDTVAVVVKENAYDGSGATSAVLTIVKGTPGAGAPAMPTSACIPLRNINVPAGASAGTGGLVSGNLSTDRRVYTAALGGIFPVASQTERDALAVRKGTMVFRDDTSRWEGYDGAAWTGFPQFKHTADGNRLDATSTAAPSHPDGLRLIAGRKSLTFTSGIATLTFPGAGFVNGVIAFNITTLSGHSATPVVDSGNVTKTAVQLAIPSFAGTVIVSYLAWGW